MTEQKVSYPRYFTAWTLEETVLLMIHYVLLGIELDLYAPSEYGTIYWYVHAELVALSVCQCLTTTTLLIS